MQRIRTSILIFGLLVVAFLNFQAGFHIHKALAHPVGDTAVAVYLADPNSEAGQSLWFSKASELGWYMSESKT